ncbi:nucleotidyltransferase family protein [Aquabacterium parvum]|uniref:nucleotidyltransferase family protein n=1 Tax=Aquabacterium parvum TaxID=70584 RepID=UPI0009F83990|nr:nucleotidyltransferase family protein [Aquabacterium parvum]MBU0917182.1 nucleotidyltransferase family protein [Gammaproteobacteria bacterium]
MLVNPASPPAPRVVALVLAAGRARRFGSDKRQACLPDGRSLLQAVLQTQLQACSDVRVLLREGDDWGQALCAQWGAAWQVVPDADQGMGHTLAAGLRALVTEEVVGTGGDHGDAQCAAHGARRFDAALVALADMPAVQPDTVRALIEAFHRDGRLAWPWYAGRPGHPRLLPRSSWPALLDLQGDEGARQRLDWSLATRVDVPDAGILVDIDTPGDLGG